jgi:hypothetical protein
VIGDVSPADLGATMAALAKLGHTNVRPELVTAISTYRQKTNHEIKAANFLREWIADHPTFKAKDAVTHFDLHGRTAGSAYSGLRDLVDEGVLKKLGEGNYARKDVKQLAAPKKKADKPKGDSTKRYSINHSDLILQNARSNGGIFTRANLKKLFSKRRRPPQSVGTSIKSLLARGLIERVKEGEYKLLKPSKNNGAAPVVTEEVHG